MPSPESPANRTTTRSSDSVRSSGFEAVSVIVAIPFCMDRTAIVHRAITVHRAPPEAEVGAAPGAPVSGERDGLVEVDVLDGVQQLDALGHRALERLAAGDEALPAGALVDDGGLHGVGQVAGALRLAAAS